ncbi:MAG: Unknown protein [uncultured Sulfurovum sp.]|uniref:DUF4276 family protein n=1 Tax=uncultured Sulfurovum sp. TaxID=269237 RepID=A0A6S6T207_9BACT|nr:MAG: Unknown protein [uncultured Sulfurovum sp.]
MKRKKNHKLKSKEDRTLLIVENSEADFFNQYFKNYLKDNHNILIDCEASGRGNKCEIANGNRMTKRITEALDREYYKAVFRMIDLKTKCFTNENTHTCLVELKKEYLPKYQIEKKFSKQFYLFVVCNEIESWFLTIDKESNNVYKNHKKELMAFLKVKSEPQIVQKMIKELRHGTYELDFSKNSSFQYFIEKLKEFK